MMPSMAENWANTPAKGIIPPTPPARRQTSHGQGRGARNHLEGIYADIANKVTPLLLLLSSLLLFSNPLPPFILHSTLCTLSMYHATFLRPFILHTE